MKSNHFGKLTQNCLSLTLSKCVINQKYFKIAIFDYMRVKYV